MYANCLFKAMKNKSKDIHPKNLKNTWKNSAGYLEDLKLLYYTVYQIVVLKTVSKCL